MYRYKLGYANWLQGIALKDQNNLVLLNALLRPWSLSN